MCPKDTRLAYPANALTRGRCTLLCWRTNFCFTGPLQAIVELTRFSGQCAAFTPRQVNEVPQNENGLVNGTPLRSDSATGNRSRNAGARGCRSPQ